MCVGGGYIGYSERLGWFLFIVVKWEFRGNKEKLLFRVVYMGGTGIGFFFIFRLGFRFGLFCF